MLKFKFGLLMVERCRSWFKSWWFEAWFWYHSDDCKLCYCFFYCKSFTPAPPSDVQDIVENIRIPMNWRSYLILKTEYHYFKKIQSLHLFVRDCTILS
jgi:hypothetical protein